MEGLTVEKFSKSGAVEGLKPALAVKWSSSENGKVWTFTLRKNVLWSDGQAFTAQHIVDSWERILNPKTAAEYAHYLYSIKNAKAYNEGKLKDFSKVGVFVDKKGQFVVELKDSQSYFPYMLSHPSTYPIRKDIIAKYGDQWTEPGNIVTLGAYTLKHWKHDKQIILEKNEKYHRQPAYIKNVLLYIIPENVTVLNLFESGRLDAVQSLPSRELAVLKKRKEHRSQEILATFFYGFNVQKKPLDDVRVRKAINMAINRKQITDLLGGDQTPLTSWIPKGMLGYNPSLGLKFDPKTANLLLDQAGYKDRLSFPRITISYNTHEDNKRVAENIQAQLKKNLNISVEISSEEWKTYLQTLKTGRQEIYRMGWVADYPDPDNFMSVMNSYSENNRSFWEHKEYDLLVETARRLIFPKKRKLLYDKAQKILVEDSVPVIPLFSSKSHWLVSDRVKSLPLNVMTQVYFKEMRF